jgi:hypothetical protein
MSTPASRSTLTGPASRYPKALRVVNARRAMHAAARYYAEGLRDYRTGNLVDFKWVEERAAALDEAAIVYGEALLASNA